MRRLDRWFGYQIAILLLHASSGSVVIGKNDPIQTVGSQHKFETFDAAVLALIYWQASQSPSGLSIVTLLNLWLPFERLHWKQSLIVISSIFGCNTKFIDIHGRFLHLGRSE